MVGTYCSTLFEILVWPWDAFGIYISTVESSRTIHLVPQLFGSL